MKKAPDNWCDKPIKIYKSKYWPRIAFTHTKEYRNEAHREWRQKNLEYYRGYRREYMRRYRRRRSNIGNMLHTHPV